MSNQEKSVVSVSREAEEIFSLTMAVMKETQKYITYIWNGAKHKDDSFKLTSFVHTRVCIYGLNDLSKRFMELVKPFNPVIYLYDANACDCEIPEGVTRLSTAKELFEKAQILVVFAPECENEVTITKELLDCLINGAVFINATNTKIVDTDALVNDVRTDRIRAGLRMSEAEAEAFGDIKELNNIIILK